ncbi:MAG: hypothetical protein P8M06_02930 [Pelagibacterales bacterium]|nr:hypothetical protein [Pelagibacterales bacterium]
MTSNTAETEDILKAIREMMGEESAQETLPKDVLDLTEKVETDERGLKNQTDSVDNGILELTNIIDDNQNKKIDDQIEERKEEVNIDDQELESIVKEKIRSKYSSKIDEIIKDEIENIISEKLSTVRVDFKNNQSN